MLSRDLPVMDSVCGMRRPFPPLKLFLGSNQQDFGCDGNRLCPQDAVHMVEDIIYHILPFFPSTDSPYHAASFFSENLGVDKHNPNPNPSRSSYKASTPSGGCSQYAFYHGASLGVMMYRKALQSVISFFWPPMPNLRSGALRRQEVRLSSVSGLDCVCRRGSIGQLRLSLAKTLRMKGMQSSYRLKSLKMHDGVRTGKCLVPW
ncbi:hypothetical protein QBC40DRAFT_70842 [Triangularia verruculosa]|uniref:Uncharacterized protein n=1 Tax=Triangularia verruculosa TaxID=2587418 RepID=A0AAN6XGT8_9PEZI|nr:hypothetical protein QBC40DRAFT_70842 [Triangularia verruculosa]